MRKFHLVVCSIITCLLCGCATQSVLYKKIGRRKGTERILPPEHVEQLSDGSAVIHILYRQMSTREIFLLKTTVSASNILSLVEQSVHKTTNSVPLIDVAACITLGEIRWSDELPSNAEAHFAALSRWGRPAANFFYSVHSLRLANREQLVALRGRLHYHERWTWWSTPVTTLLLAPAICWDVLTAVFQIPYFTLVDAIQSGLALEPPGSSGLNPWQKLRKPRRFPSPRILDPHQRRILITQETYDDIEYDDARGENMLHAYWRYVLQRPDGLHITDAQKRIIQFVEAEDQRQYHDARCSLSKLKRFIKTHPQSKQTELARINLETRLNNVAVLLSTPQTNLFTMDGFMNELRAVRSPRYNQIFTLGTTTHAEVQSFLGPGIPSVSSNNADRTTYTWEVRYHRGKYIPAYMLPPSPYTWETRYHHHSEKYIPDYIIPPDDYDPLPVRPLALTFNSNSILSEIREDPRVVEPLISALKDKDWDVRRRAAEALGKIGDLRAVEPLISALMGEDRGVRANAAETLDKLGWKAKNEREKIFYLIYKRDLKGCVEMGRPAVEPLISALKDESGRVRILAAEALGKIGDPRAVEPLAGALKDEGYSVRRKAAEALGKIGDPRAVEPLTVALKDEHYYVRRRAAEALGKIGDPRAVEPLTGAVKDKDRDVRKKAAEALGKIGDPRAVEPLTGAVKDKNWDVRSAAAEALGKIGDPRGVKHLIAALKDEHYYVRRKAAEALGKTGDPRGVEPLISALKDEDCDVRSAAAEALIKIGKPAVEPLTAALKDEYWCVRKVAAEALGKIGDSRAVEPLTDTVGKDRNWGVREAAKKALKKIESK